MNGLSTLRQQLPQAAQSIRNAPSAVIRWQPKPSRQPAAVSILTATAASGRTMPTTTGMSAPAAIRKIQQRIPPANGSSTPQQLLQPTAQSIRNALFASVYWKPVRFRQSAAVSIPTTTALTGNPILLTTGKNAPAAIRLMLQHTALSGW